MLVVMARRNRSTAQFISTSPPKPGVDATLFTEVDSLYEEHISRLRLVAADSAIAGALCLDHERERDAEYLQNFLRQFLTFAAAADATKGSERALLNYYAALNLAKAGLTRTHAHQVAETYIGHGMGVEWAGSKDYLSHSIKVPKHDPSRLGVFRLLAQQLGAAIPEGSFEVSIASLLALIPEVQAELHTMTPSDEPKPPYNTREALQVLLFQGEHIWSMLAVHRTVVDDPSRALTKTLLEHYDEVPLAEIDDWRKLFALSSRATGTELRFLEEKATHTSLPEAGRAVTEHLSPFMSPSRDQRGDLYLSHAITDDPLVALGPTLARYACLYYASNVVRYRPYVFDPHERPGAGWLFDILARESAYKVTQDLFTFATDRFLSEDRSGRRT